MLPHPDEYFSPKSAIRDDKAQLFRGRTELLSSAVKAASGEGAALYIYGERGVGKTSFAWRLKNILERSDSADVQPFLSLLPRNKQFSCVWVECKDYMNDLGGLLVSLLRPQSDAASLSKVFPKVYKSKDLKDHVKRTYEIGLPKIASLKWEFEASKSGGGNAEPSVVGRESSSAAQQIRFLFEDIIEAIHNEEPEQEIVIFIDEFDRLADNRGIGSLIKSSNGVRFILIGVADDLDDILGDHPSVARKLYGADFLVPGLSNEDISGIFNYAQKSTGGVLSFSQSFLDKAIQYSGGYPWIAQQIGYNAVLGYEFEKLESLKLTDKDCDKAISTVSRVHLEGKFGAAITEIVDTSTKAEILEVLWQRDGWVREDEISAAINPKFRKFLTVQLPDLVQGKIIKKTKDDSFKLTDGITRILVRYCLDQITEQRVK